MVSRAGLNLQGTDSTSREYATQTRYANELYGLQIGVVDKHSSKSKRKSVAQICKKTRRTISVNR